jgi:potassium efflux system protein
VWYARRLLWALLREDGIAVAELRAKPEVARQLDGITRWACAAAALLVLPWWVLSSAPPSLVHLPRILYAFVLAALAALLYFLLRPRGALARSLTGGRGPLHRAMYLVAPAVAAGMLAIMVMDLRGYRFGARLLVKNVLESLLMAMVLVVAYHLLIRVFEETANRIRRRTLKETGERQEAREQSQEAFSQVTSLLSVGLIVAAVLMLGRSWGVSATLHGILDSVHLHTVDPDAGVSLTLLDALLAVAWIAGGHFLVHHLPGLFEVLVFSRIETVSPGTRFVVVQLTRYGILLVSYCAAVLTLHLDFSSLGYVVAALSVGIGFGLQEIISNFVSGLILFVEQPVRVGDVVSVGGVEGTVDRISIRATQIVNFDRQVLIIPNRKFIAEDVKNWSHNDPIVRGTIPIGVSYGSDVEQVERVLLGILEAHPRVLHRPPPSVLFLSFGESSLDFQARFHTLIENRIETIHEINREVARKFRDENIEIPFPQRDLHVRSVDGEVLRTVQNGCRPPQA